MNKGWRLPWVSWCIIVLAGAVLAWVAFWQEPRSTTLTALDVATPACPADVPAVRVVFVSDIHVDGAHTGRARVAALVQAVNLLDPDVILLGGDYVGGMLWQAGPMGAPRAKRSEASVQRDEAALAELAGLRARYGVFAVIGNHDCWWHCERMRRLLETAGIVVLSNEAREIMRPGLEPFWITGIADGQTQSPGFEQAASQIPDGGAVLLVMHNAGLFDWEEDVFPVQFAGHTHAGQVRFPLIGAPVRMSRHTEDTAADGFTIEDGRVLIVSRGFGEVGLPVRFGAPPQIMLVHVRHGAQLSVRRLS
jgi:uncharacterized protein